MSGDNYVVGNQDTTTVEIVDSSPTVEFGAVSYTLNEDQGATNPYDYPNGYTYVVELVRSGDLTNLVLMFISMSWRELLFKDKITSSIKITFSLNLDKVVNLWKFISTMMS